MFGSSQLVSVADYEQAARRRLPKSVYDLVAGGAADEVTIRRNIESLRRISLRPRALVDVPAVDTSITVFGRPLALPVLLAPTGWQRMVHRQAELGTARGASRAGIGYVQSTVTSYPMEQIAAESSAPRWFQLYKRTGPTGPAETDQLVEQAQSVGFDALCVTIDTAVLGLRERDVRNRVATPFRIRPRLVRQCAVRPRWALDFALGGAGRGSFGLAQPADFSMKGAAAALERIQATVTVADIERLRALWAGPLVVKGVLNPADCEQLIDLGVDGIVVSNHGGRQLDGVEATIDVLPEMVAAADGRVPIFVDGGIRRGSDIVKALAIGATACLIGRPYVWGLAVAGEDGVAGVVEILRRELENTMTLLGCDRVTDLDPSYLGPRRS